MFWSQLGTTYAEVDAFFARLDDEDIPLNEVLDKDEVLQTLKSIDSNGSLVRFLCKEEIFNSLIDLVTKEPDCENVDIEKQFKYPNITSELLTAQVDEINNKLKENTDSLKRLYDFFAEKADINPLMASLHSKVFLHVIRIHATSLEYLSSRERFVDLICSHLHISAYYDFLGKLLQQQSTMEWLRDQKIVEHLMKLLAPEAADVTDATREMADDRATHASLLLCDLVNTTRQTENDVVQSQDMGVLMKQIVDPQLISATLNRLFYESDDPSDDERRTAKPTLTKPCLLANISFLNCLLAWDSIEAVNSLGMIEDMFPSMRSSIDFGRRRVPEPPKQPAYVQSVAAAVLPFVDNFATLLPVTSDQQTFAGTRYESVTLTHGEMKPPLGQVRLKIAELIHHLVRSGVADVAERVASSGAIASMQQLFVAYPNNSLFHNQFLAIVEQVLKPFTSPPQKPSKNDDEKPRVSEKMSTCQDLRDLDDADEGDTKDTKEAGDKVDDVSTNNADTSNSSAVPERDALLPLLKMVFADDVNQMHRWLLATHATISDSLPVKETPSNDDANETGDKKDSNVTEAETKPKLDKRVRIAYGGHVNSIGQLLVALEERLKNESEANGATDVSNIKEAHDAVVDGDCVKDKWTAFKSHLQLVAQSTKADAPHNVGFSSDDDEDDAPSGGGRNLYNKDMERLYNDYKNVPTQPELINSFTGVTEAKLMPVLNSTDFPFREPFERLNFSAADGPDVDTEAIFEAVATHRQVIEFGDLPNDMNNDAWPSGQSSDGECNDSADLSLDKDSFFAGLQSKREGGEIVDEGDVSRSSSSSSDDDASGPKVIHADSAGNTSLNDSTDFVWHSAGEAKATPPSKKAEESTPTNVEQPAPFIANFDEVAGSSGQESTKADVKDEGWANFDGASTNESTKEEKEDTSVA